MKASDTGSDLFFSERDAGIRPPVVDQLDQTAWGGIVSLVLRRVADGSFGDAFPHICDDPGKGTIATAEGLFWPALQAAVPELPVLFRPTNLPSTAAAMDVLEFAARHVARVTEGNWHGFFDHHHLEFDRVAGLADLRREANQIFRRSGFAFAMDRRGKVDRLAPPVVRERVARTLPSTGRPSLDARLARAVEKYKSPDLREREEALEKLWDAWEEIKTIYGKKTSSIARLIGDVAAHPRYVGVLDADGLALTAIGNDFQIRHSETDRIPLEGSSQVDYFFGRLFNLVWLFLTALGNESAGRQ